MDNIPKKKNTGVHVAEKFVFVFAKSPLVTGNLWLVQRYNKYTFNLEFWKISYFAPPPSPPRFLSSHNYVLY